MDKQTTDKMDDFGGDMLWQLVVYRRDILASPAKCVIAWKTFDLKPGQYEYEFQVSAGIQLVLTDLHDQVLDFQRGGRGEMFEISEVGSQIRVRQIESRLAPDKQIKVDNKTNNNRINVTVQQDGKTASLRKDLHPGEAVVFQLDERLYLNIRQAVREGDFFDESVLSDCVTILACSGNSVIKVYLQEQSRHAWSISSASITGYPNQRP